MDNTNSISMKTIQSLLEDTAKKKVYHFFIRDYQRGYRWTENQVKALLNDIYGFESNEGEKNFYCLQPVVVKQNKDDSNKLNVIDGQQRLTTIYIILKALAVDPKYTIEYETREKSADFLNTLSQEGDDNTNIDYYYMIEAYETIKKWLDIENIKKFKKNLLDHTQVIWYEITDNEDQSEEEIFRRLNSQKIPLTNAELIKALFLTKSTSTKIENKPTENQQSIVALEWDKIETTLCNDDFWYFIYKPEKHEKENKYSSRIEYIFDLMTGKTKNEKDDFYTFQEFSEDKKNEYTWNKVKEYFRMFENWYLDIHMFHYIGFLIVTNTKIKDIKNMYESSSKSEFKKQLKKKIKSTLMGEETDIAKFLNIISYNDHYSAVKNVLLLFNIISLDKDISSIYRFPFDKYQDKKNPWSLEHIHAQQSEDINKSDRINWMTNYWSSIDKEEQSKCEYKSKIEEIKNNESKEINDEDFEKIHKCLVEKTSDFSTEYEVHSIANLVLLDKNTNSSLSNSPFLQKRELIINAEKNRTFIPRCTKNVFLKYYSEDLKDPYKWTSADMKSYNKAIQSTLTKFFEEEN